MNEAVKQLKAKADKARALYNLGHINRDEAKKLVMPYINAVNAKSIEIAKKYKMKPKLVNFQSYIR